MNETETGEVKESPSPEQEVFDTVIKPELQHLRRVSEYYKEKADFTWIINDVKSFLNGSEKEIESEVFPLTGYPFGARAKITTYSREVYFSLSFQPITNESIAEEEMRVQRKPRIYFTVKDQSERTERKDLIRTKLFYYKNKLEFNSYYYVGFTAKNLIIFPPYKVRGQWAIDIHVEAPEVAQSVYSEDGTLTWAIDDFRKKKQAERDGLIECHFSPYFYTGPKGYRVQLKAFLTEFHDSGLTIEVVLLDGVHDEDLGRFARKTTVTIVHPTEPTRSISQSQENQRWFYMGSEAEIETFLHNDTLYYKVTIEIIQPK